jgi:hypothetical protein
LLIVFRNISLNILKHSIIEFATLEDIDIANMSAVLDVRPSAEGMVLTMYDVVTGGALPPVFIEDNPMSGLTSWRTQVSAWRTF